RLDRGHGDSLPEPLREGVHELGDVIPADDRDAGCTHHAAAIRIAHDILGEQAFKAVEVAGLRCRDEGIQKSSLLFRSHGFVLGGGEVLLRSAEQLAGAHLARLHDLRDLCVAVVEGRSQHIGGSLGGRELLEQNEHGETESLAAFGTECRIGARVNGFGKPRADVALAPHSRGLHEVDGESGGGGGEKCGRILHGGAVVSLPAQPGLLHDVFRVAHRAEHPIGDTEQARTDGGEYCCSGREVAERWGVPGVRHRWCSGHGRRSLSASRVGDCGIECHKTGTNPVLVSMKTTTSGKRRILIVGGGYAGFYTAWKLEKRLSAAEAELTIVDPRPYMTYQPFLPEVSAGSIEARHAAISLRSHLRRTRIIAGSALAIDHSHHTVSVRPVEGDDFELSYDIIVVTAGAVTRTFPIPGIAEEAIGMKHVEEAVAIRDRLLTSFDRASVLPAGPERARLMTVTFVGGGFSGVEGFGELLSLATALLKSYPELRFAELNFHLVEASPRILPEVSDA